MQKVFTPLTTPNKSDYTAIMELYNMTDNVTFDNSRIKSNKPRELSPVQISKNMYSEIPNKPIDIGMILRAEKEGSFAAVYTGGNLRSLYIIANTSSVFSKVRLL